MPLERYNELMLENKRMMEELDNSVTLDEYNELKAKLDEVVSIRERWDGRPALNINLDVLKETIEEKLLQSKFAGKWVMKDISDHVETIWDVFKEIPQVADEDEEDQA